MTTPGDAGGVSPESIGKTRLQQLKARPTRNRPLPQLLGGAPQSKVG
jgi:hypothetical protein